MTITAYLFDHTLNVMFGGNKSECARNLCIRRTDFNRIQQRFADGATSPRAIEAILLFYCHKQGGMDDVLRGYSGDSTENATGRSLPPDEEIQWLREKMTKEWQIASTRMRLYKEASDLMALLQEAFCSEKCSRIHDCETECPCKKFAEYLAWAETELDKVTADGDPVE